MKNGDTVILKQAQSILINSSGAFSIELDAGAIGTVVEDDNAVNQFEETALTQDYTSTVKVRFRIINTFSVEKTIAIDQLQEFKING